MNCKYAQVRLPAAAGISPVGQPIVAIASGALPRAWSVDTTRTSVDSHGSNDGEPMR